MTREMTVTRTRKAKVMSELDNDGVSKESVELFAYTLTIGRILTILK